MTAASVKKGWSVSSLLSLVFALLALVLLPFNEASTGTQNSMFAISILLVGLFAFWLLLNRQQGLIAASLSCGVVLLGAWLVLTLVHSLVKETTATLAIWFFVVALAFLTWQGLQLLSGIKTQKKIGNILLGLFIPMLFGAWIFFLWEVVTTGFAVPQVLLPAPSVIWQVFDGAGPTLAADFYQTFVRAVIPGFIIGSGTGFITAIAADRIPFLQRGLIPLGNFVSAIPIVGIAPIMVMWFGFDWQSKAAVVAIMTFFPMLVNTLTGLADSNKIERDLLVTYAAGYWRELASLRLPTAMPFILNALKINSTMAMIGAIVAEFFGTPIVGMGFRISTEVGRMNIDMVWATIAVAAVAGSMFYGLFAVLERVLTFWHPSMRKA